MKRLTIAVTMPLLLTLVALGATASAAPDATWQLQAPQPTSFHLNAVDMISATEGWAVGDVGTIIHTTDGGATWSSQASGTTEPLYTVTFKDALHGWAGTNNAILYTTNGGGSWNKGTGVVGGIYGIGFATLTTGFAGWGGDILFKTTNGGQSWGQVSVPLDVLRVQFFSATAGVASGPGGVLHTTNAGATWSPTPGPHGGFFVDPGEGWYVSQNIARHTTNGGVTWQNQTLPAGSWIYSGASFADALNGWAAGETGDIVHTSNGGATWTTQSSPVTDRLWAVDAVDALHAVAVGEGPSILTTTDGGTTWVSRVNGPGTITYDVDATDAQHAWAAEAFGQILFTHDGGVHWNRRLVGSPYGHFWGIDCLADSLHCWAVGDADQSNNTGMVYASDDGGDTWSLQWQGAFGDLQILYDVAAVDLRTVVAVGAFGVYRTTNGGATWKHIGAPAGLLSDVTFVGKTGYAVGNNGLILKSTNKGRTWSVVGQGVTNETLMGVSFATPKVGWAVGWNQTVVRTTNGGQTWTHQAPHAPAGTNLLVVDAVSTSVAWIGGGPVGGYIARTTNGGTTWAKESPLPGNPYSVSGISFVTSDMGWAGGHWGIWLRTP